MIGKGQPQSYQHSLRSEGSGDSDVTVAFLFDIKNGFKSDTSVQSSKEVNILPRMAMMPCVGISSSVQGFELGAKRRRKTRFEDASVKERMDRCYGLWN